MRVYPVHNKLLVPTSAAVMTVDLATRKVVTGLAAGGRQHIALPLPSGEMLGTNGATDAAVFADVQTGAVLASVPVAKGPDDAALDPQSGLVLVVGHAGGAVTLLDPKARTVVAEVPVGGVLEEIVADGRGRAFVNVEDRNEIAVFDIAAHKIVARWRLPGCVGPTGLAYDARDRFLIAACQGATVVVPARVLDLADGTHIRLNAASSLSVALRRHARELAMGDGEAAFDVAHDPTRPFLIAVGDREVRVVGTEFNIRRRGGATALTVRRGVVELRRAGAPAITPTRVGVGQQLIHRDGSVASELSAVEPGLAFAWTEGQLIYQDAPMGEVAAELSRRFGAPVRIADARTARLPFTGVPGDRQRGRRDAADRGLLAGHRDPQRRRLPAAPPTLIPLVSPVLSRPGVDDDMQARPRGNSAGGPGALMAECGCLWTSRRSHGRPPPRLCSGPCRRLGVRPGVARGGGPDEGAAGSRQRRHAGLP